jgi:hypothetical protein
VTSTRKFRLALADELFPVQAALNAPGDDDFLRCLQTLMVEGFDYNGAGCVPAQNDRDRQLSFYVLDEELMLSGDAALPHILTALRAFVEDHPTAKIEAEALASLLTAALSRQTAP